MLGQRKPPPRRLPQPKVVRDSRISGLTWIRILMYVCRIAPKMLWIHYLVGVSHFAECRESRLVTMRNANKSPEIPIGGGSAKETRNPYSGSDHHQKLISSSDCRPIHNIKFQCNQL